MRLPVRMLTISQSAIAPESMRIEVKVAGSIAVCFNAMRHSSELPANAIIANDVRITIRVREITRTNCGDLNVENSSLREQTSWLEIAVSYNSRLDPPKVAPADRDDSSIYTCSRNAFAAATILTSAALVSGHLR